jgi:hypothetical protein
LPFVMAMANCTAWTAYSFLINEWFLSIPNALGGLIGMFLFLNSFGLGIPKSRDRDMTTAVCMTLAAVLFTAAIVERMVITDLSIKKQIWGFTGATYR